MEHQLASFADKCFEAEVVKFGAFRLKLHKENPDAPLSPYYLDYGNLMSFPQTACLGAQLMHNMMPEEYSRIVDVPTRITSFVGLMGGKFSLPVLNPKLTAKDHGLEGKIVGVYKKGDRVVVIDDLVTSGASALPVIELLESEGLVIAGIRFFTDRLQGGMGKLKDMGYDVRALFTIEEQIERYVETGQITAEKRDETFAYIGL